MYFRFSLTIEEEGGQYAAYCPELGIAMSGDTFEEAKQNLKTAISLVIKASNKKGEFRDLIKEHHIECSLGPPRKRRETWNSESIERVPA